VAEQIGEAWLKGNYGEHLVAQILSRSCLVRPVVGHTDVGVDLYCESIIRGNPFLHFWGQVKGSQNFPNERANVPCSFSVSALQYWANQPVPVLAFLVPMNWPPEDIQYIHVVDVTFDILEYGILTGQSTQTLTSKAKLILPISNTNELTLSLRSLLVDHIPMVVSAMYAENGFLFPAPKPQQEYVKYFATNFLSRYMPQIELRLRNAMTFGILQYIGAGYSLDNVPKLLLSALETLHDDLHYEVHETLGVVRQAHGDIVSARSFYEKSIQCIRNDPHIDTTMPPWSEAISRLNERIQSLNDEK